MKHNTLIHSDLRAAQTLAYERIGLVCNNFIPETESQDYGACTFELDSKKIKFRAAKITPTKIGQFVTFWKRIGNGPIMPYDISDQFDFLIVSVRSGNNFGQFVFNKSVLLEQKIISQYGKGGKRAIRVYSPWDVADNQQAKKTQAWQLNYFFAIQPTIEVDQAKKLLF